ncbi:SRPBCC family protein [Nakamurella sp. GG22]
MSDVGRAPQSSHDASVDFAVGSSVGTESAGGAAEVSLSGRQPGKDSAPEASKGSPTEGKPVVSKVVAAPADVVWSVLADGWQYATWVVGASRIREVDRNWPDEGSRIHHSVGLWPLLIDDSTDVVRSEPERELVLKARGWPIGEAHISITLTPERAEHTTVSITEDATAGPGRAIPAPVRQLAIGPRNVETLRRLALIAEGRYRLRLEQALPGGSSGQAGA